MWEVKWTDQCKKWSLPPSMSLATGHANHSHIIEKTRNSESDPYNNRIPLSNRRNDTYSMP
jgi:hypothetical protein